MNSKEREQRERQLFQLNKKVAEALGYRVSTTTDEDGSYAVIVAPDGIDIEFTGRDTDDYDCTLEELVEDSWGDLLASDMREYATEEEWEELPPQWAEDASAAAELIALLPKEYELSLKSNRQIELGKVKWYCSLVHTEVTKCTGSGLCDTPAEAICRAWLTAMAIEHAQTFVAQPPEETDDEWKQRMMNTLDGLSQALSLPKDD